VSYAEIVEVAANVMGRRAQARVDLELADVVVDYPNAAAVLLRARVLDGPAGLPPTVIVKRGNVGEGVEMEWAGLAFAAELPEVGSFVPRLYGGDAEQRVLVMSDLGGPGVRRVGDLLFEPPGGPAEAALIGTQVRLGRLHAAGFGKQATYGQILAGRSDARASRHPVNKLEKQLRDLPQVLAQHLGQPASWRLEQEIKAAAAELFEPSGFTTFTHGDPTVGNLLYSPESPAAGVKLVDFETAGYRHALLDGCFARLRYLFSVWAHHIPVVVQERLLAASRNELVNGHPPAGDDTVFSRALVAASAAWLAAFCSHLERVADADARWGRVSWRQRISAGLEHFVTLADERNQLPVLRDHAQLLLDRLHDAWPASDRRMPTYPALAAT
jgi:hypothetical protein